MEENGRQLNTRSAGVRRLMQEAKELREPTEMYHAQPIEDNLFEWHFTVRGPADSDFEGGVYHGRMIFPAEYPMKPPNIIILTPNGRFELNKKICLSISGYHPETWLPSWSIRTALLAIVGFMPTSGKGAIGSADYPSKERKKLAIQSKKWKCNECGIVMENALKPHGEDGKKAETEARSLIDSAGDSPAPSTQIPSVDHPNSPDSVSTVPIVHTVPYTVSQPSSMSTVPPTRPVATNPPIVPHPSSQNDTVIWTLLVLLSAIVMGLAYRRFFLLD
ncbi:hypothetical protein PFISCL1PPCAC_5769 [Pristionchus fissidentatus]|uniref:UBC core domain-containing protein n=1 Tax=Pristionchus fissidentatus TaxID=1538716 RepID=A0AAV5V886_9BILA|nr:hypothetical protein PFISCL1PPCAC_5769 [Pristionchus fissidentatus]